MARAITPYTTIAGTNTILQSSGFNGPRARLCGRKNLILKSSFELNYTGWVPIQTGTILSLEFDPTNIFGRNVLGVNDSSASYYGYARTTVDNQAPVKDEVFLISMWVKRISGADTAFEVGYSNVSGGHYYGTVGQVDIDDWAFFHWVMSPTDSAFAGQTQFYLHVYPCVGSETSVGKLHIARPRVLRVFETLNNLPKDPLVELRFKPNFWNEPLRNRFGKLEYARRGVIPYAVCNHPVVDTTHMADIGAIHNHDGYVLFEPEELSSVAFLMTADGEWAYEYLSGRAIGYQGQLLLQGVDPIFGVPEASLYIEEEDRFYVVWTNYVRG